MIIKTVLGGACGAFVGLMIGRARICSTEGCKSRLNLAYSIIAGAAFGATLTWVALTR